MIITVCNLSCKCRRVVDKLLLLQVTSTCTHKVLVNIFLILAFLLNSSSLVFHPLMDVLFPLHPGTSASVMHPHLVLLVETNFFGFFHSKKGKDKMEYLKMA